MFRRLFITAFALFQLFWLGVYIPGHVRGAITFDGPSTSTPSAKSASKPSCCAADAPATSEHESQPSSRDRAHCVVCYFVAGLDTPPPVLLVPALTQSALLPPLPLPDRPWIAAQLLAFDATAPPAPTLD